MFGLNKLNISLVLRFLYLTSLMPRIIGRIVGMSSHTEMLITTLLCLVTNVVNWSPFDWNDQLKKVWELPIAERSFYGVEHFGYSLKIVLSTVILVRNFTAPLHLLCYVLMLYSILTWKRPGRILSFCLIVGAFKNILMNLVSTVAGILLCWAERHFRWKTGEFLVVQMMSMTPSIYLWRLVRHYSESCESENTEDRVSARHHENIDSNSIDQRTRTIEPLEGSTMTMANMYEDCLKISSISNIEGGLLSQAAVDVGLDFKYSKSLATLLTTESLDSEDIILPNIDDIGLTPAEKSMRILGLTQEDVANVRARMNKLVSTSSLKLNPESDAEDDVGSSFSVVLETQDCRDVCILVKRHCDRKILEEDRDQGDSSTLKSCSCSPSDSKDGCFEYDSESLVRNELEEPENLQRSVSKECPIVSFDLATLERAMKITKRERRTSVDIPVGLKNAAVVLCYDFEAPKSDDDLRSDLGREDEELSKKLLEDRNDTKNELFYGERRHFNDFVVMVQKALPVILKPSVDSLTNHEEQASVIPEHEDGTKFEHRQGSSEENAVVSQISGSIEQHLNTGFYPRDYSKVITKAKVVLSKIKLPSFEQKVRIKGETDQDSLIRHAEDSTSFKDSLKFINKSLETPLPIGANLQYAIQQLECKNWELFRSQLESRLSSQTLIDRNVFSRIVQSTFDSSQSLRDRVDKGNGSRKNLIDVNQVELETNDFVRETEKYENFSSGFKGKFEDVDRKSLLHNWQNGYSTRNNKFPSYSIRDTGTQMIPEERWGEQQIERSSQVDSTHYLISRGKFEDFRTLRTNNCTAQIFLQGVNVDSSEKLHESNRLSSRDKWRGRSRLDEDSFTERIYDDRRVKHSKGSSYPTGTIDEEGRYSQASGKWNKYSEYFHRSRSNSPRYQFEVRRDRDELSSRGSMIGRDSFQTIEKPSRRRRKRDLEEKREDKSWVPPKISAGSRMPKSEKSRIDDPNDWGTVTLAQVARSSGYEEAALKTTKSPACSKKKMIVNRTVEHENETLKTLPVSSARNSPEAEERGRSMSSSRSSKMRKLSESIEEREAREMRALRAYNQKTLLKYKREMEARRQKVVSVEAQGETRKFVLSLDTGNVDSFNVVENGRQEEWQDKTFELDDEEVASNVDREVERYSMSIPSHQSTNRVFVHEKTNPLNVPSEDPAQCFFRMAGAVTLERMDTYSGNKLRQEVGRIKTNPSEAAYRKQYSKYSRPRNDVEDVSSASCKTFEGLQKGRDLDRTPAKENIRDQLMSAASSQFYVEPSTNDGNILVRTIKSFTLRNSNSISTSSMDFDVPEGGQPSTEILRSNEDIPRRIEDSEENRQVRQRNLSINVRQAIGNIDWTFCPQGPLITDGPRIRQFDHSVQSNEQQIEFREIVYDNTVDLLRRAFSFNPENTERGFHLGPGTTELYPIYDNTLVTIGEIIKAAALTESVNEFTSQPDMDIEMLDAEEGFVCDSYVASDRSTSNFNADHSVKVVPSNEVSSSGADQDLRNDDFNGVDIAEERTEDVDCSVLLDNNGHFFEAKKISIPTTRWHYDPLRVDTMEATSVEGTRLSLQDVVYEFFNLSRVVPNAPRPFFVNDSVRFNATSYVGVPEEFNVDGRSIQDLVKELTYQFPVGTVSQTRYLKSFGSPTLRDPEEIVDKANGKMIDFKMEAINALHMIGTPSRRFTGVPESVDKFSEGSNSLDSSTIASSEQIFSTEPSMIQDLEEEPIGRSVKISTISDELPFTASVNPEEVDLEDSELSFRKSGELEDVSDVKTSPSFTSVEDLPPEELFSPTNSELIRRLEFRKRIVISILNKSMSPEFNLEDLTNSLVLQKGIQVDLQKFDVDETLSLKSKSRRNTILDSDISKNDVESEKSFIGREDDDAKEGNVIDDPSKAGCTESSSGYEKISLLLTVRQEDEGETALEIGKGKIHEGLFNERLQRSSEAKTSEDKKKLKPRLTRFEYRCQMHLSRRGRGLSSGYLMDYDSEGMMMVSHPSSLTIIRRSTDAISMSKRNNVEIIASTLKTSEVFPLSECTSFTPIKNCRNSSSDKCSEKMMYDDLKMILKKHNLEERVVTHEAFHDFDETVKKVDEAVMGSYLLDEEEDEEESINNENQKVIIRNKIVEFLEKLKSTSFEIILNELKNLACAYPEDDAEAKSKMLEIVGLPQFTLLESLISYLRFTSKVSTSTSTPQVLHGARTVVTTLSRSSTKLSDLRRKSEKFQDKRDSFKDIKQILSQLTDTVLESIALCVGSDSKLKNDERRSLHEHQASSHECSPGLSSENRIVPSGSQKNAEVSSSEKTISVKEYESTLPNSSGFNAIPMTLSNLVKVQGCWDDTEQKMEDNPTKTRELDPETNFSNSHELLHGERFSNLSSDQYDSIDSLSSKNTIEASNASGSAVSFDDDSFMEEFSKESLNSLESTSTLLKSQQEKSEDLKQTRNKKLKSLGGPSSS